MSRLLPAILALSVAFASAATAAPALRVAATHPIIGDLARQVGGANVEVLDLLKPGADMHHFEPTPKDLAALKGIALVLASGMHLENYLDKLRDSLGAGSKVVNIGRPLPSVTISDGVIDPHWWHSAENMIRAARGVADEFAAVDPANAAAYKAGAEAAGKKFAALKSWAQQEIAVIPKSDRKLVTAHTAFGYFCKEYGFQSIPVLGLSREDDASPQYIARTIKIIRDNKIRAVFPEDQANPKVLKEIVRETGVKIGGELIADGTSPGEGSTFEGLIKHNVTTIVAALKP